MPAPTPLTIATQSVQRLVKEEKYYRKELEQQNERVKKLETDLKNGEASDSNAGYVLKQEVCLNSPLPPYPSPFPYKRLFTTKALGP